MKDKGKQNLFARAVIFLSVLIIGIAAAAIGLFYYIFSIPEPEGASIADWPQRFTDNFSLWTTYENGQITVEEIGLERLDQYGLWIQYINESGEEIFSHNKPGGWPESYLASELLALNASHFENGYTVFVSTMEDGGETCSYVVGFPYDVGKLTLYYNGARVSRLSVAAKILIMAAFAALVILIVAYSVWLSRKLSKVVKGIGDLSQRKYHPLKEKGVFAGIYASLNQMGRQLKQADQLQAETERTRQAWIANITHDLKTPMSPIKGYAELLADHGVKETKDIQEWGKIILKNVDHAEKLINDLKLTYQLESGAIPYHPKNVRIGRYVKEWVIDIVNDPAFSDRDIGFENHAPEAEVSIDADLFRRAVTNLVVNALTHNPPETKVAVAVGTESENKISISIRDNGTGISKEGQAQLFNRYYRGTNTKEKPEGSGLGLAIAKQIVTLHGGNITVKSQMHIGTEFLILLPKKN